MTRTTRLSRRIYLIGTGGRSLGASDLTKSIYGPYKGRDQPERIFFHQDCRLASERLKIALRAPYSGVSIYQAGGRPGHQRRFRCI